MKASTSHTDWNGMWLSFFATLARVPGADLSYRWAMGQCTCALPMSSPLIAQLACTSEVHHSLSASGLTHAGKSPSISDEANRRLVWDGWKPHLCYGSKAPARLSSMTVGLHRYDNTHRRDLKLSPFKPHLPTRRNHRPSWFRHIFHFPSGVVEEVFFGSLSALDSGSLGSFLFHLVRRRFGSPLLSSIFACDRIFTVLRSTCTSDLESDSNFISLFRLAELCRGLRIAH